MSKSRYVQAASKALAPACCPTIFRATCILKTVLVWMIIHGHACHRKSFFLTFLETKFFFLCLNKKPYGLSNYNCQNCRGFPGGPMVRMSNGGGAGSIPGQEAKIPRASWPKSRNIKQKQCCNKFNKDLKMVHIKKY